MTVPDWVTLGEREEIVWSGAPTLFLATWSLLGGFLLVGVGSALYGTVLSPESGYRWVGVVVLVAGVVLLSYPIVRLRSTRYVITTNEVYRKEGVFSRRVTSLRLDRIQNVSFEQSILQRLLMYGDVRIDTAGTGGTEITFDGVANPKAVSGTLNERLDEPAAR